MVDPIPFQPVASIHAQLSAMREEIEALKKGGGGGTSGGMDPWQTTVETRLGDLRNDIRALDQKVDNRFFWLLGTMGAGFLTLAAMMITGYLRLADAIAALHH